MAERERMIRYTVITQQCDCKGKRMIMVGLELRRRRGNHNGTQRTDCITVKTMQQLGN